MGPGLNAQPVRVQKNRRKSDGPHGVWAGFGSNGHEAIYGNTSAVQANGLEIYYGARRWAQAPHTRTITYITRDYEYPEQNSTAH